VNNSVKDDRPAEPLSGVGGIAHSIGARNLWIIILTMPAVFLAAVAAIIAIFGKPGDETAEEIPAAVAEAAPAASEIPAVEAISVPAGAAPGAIALDGDRLAVRIDGPDGTVVVVYDLARGEVVARVPFTAEE
jgi:hypothetical protein